MNEDIVRILEKEINEKGMTLTFVSKKTGIEYQRLMRIFNQNAKITGSELLRIGRLIGLDLQELQDSLITRA